MTAPPDDQSRGAGERYARAALSFLADPGDPALGARLRIITPQAVLAAVTAPEPGASPIIGETGGRVLKRLRSKLSYLPLPGDLDRWAGHGYRLVCPGQPEWPTQLDDLGDARPLVLWLRGPADLRFACLRSVAVGGSGAAAADG